MNAIDVLGLKQFNTLKHSITIANTRRMAGEREGVAYAFGYILPDDFMRSCAESICKSLGHTFVQCRANQYGISDFIEEHTDTGYPGCYTTIVCLLHSGDSLRIDGELVREYEGSLITMAPNTKHSIDKGKIRTSLVLWSKKL